jgi:branched-chain amino acid transport system substrate-binding protein
VLNNFGVPTLGVAATNVMQGLQIGEQYVYSHGGVYNGAKFKLVTADEGATPGTTTTGARTLLGKGIKIISGPAITPDTEAAGPLFDSAGAIFFSDATTTSVTGANRSLKNVYRIGTDDAMNAKGLATVVGPAEKAASVVNVFGYDYQEGKDAWTSLQSLLKQQGLKFSSPQQIFVPLTATTYTAQVGSMVNGTTGSAQRVLALLTYGGGDLNFLQEAKSVGLLAKYSAVLTTDEYYLEGLAFKGKAPAVWNAYDVCDWQLYKNAEMNYLETEYHAQTGSYPSDWVVQGFDQMLEIAAAVNKAKSSSESAVSAALSGLRVPMAVGSVTMNGSTHQAEVPTSVCETEGDPSAPGGLKLIKGEAVPFSVAGS